MQQLTPDQVRRWDAWQRANELTFRRTDRMCRIVAFGVLAAILLNFVIALWYR
jgi:hypothetical protein